MISERDANLRQSGLLVTHGHLTLAAFLFWRSILWRFLYFYFHFDAVGGLAVGIALSTLRKVFLLLPLTFSLSVVLILAPVI